MNKKKAKRLRKYIKDNSPQPVLTKKEFLKIEFPNKTQRDKFSRFYFTYKEFKRRYNMISAKQKYLFWEQVEAGTL